MKGVFPDTFLPLCEVLCSNREQGQRRSTDHESTDVKGSPIFLFPTASRKSR